MNDATMKCRVEDYVSTHLTGHTRVCGDGQLESVMRKAFEAGWRARYAGYNRQS